MVEVKLFLVVLWKTYDQHRCLRVEFTQVLTDSMESLLSCELRLRGSKRRDGCMVADVDSTSGVFIKSVNVLMNDEKYGEGIGR